MPKHTGRLPIQQYFTSDIPVSLSVHDVDTKYDYFNSTITDANHRFFPEKLSRLLPAVVLWITPRIKRINQQRDRAFYHNKTNLYKTFSNKAIREIRIGKVLLPYETTTTEAV